MKNAIIASIDDNMIKNFEKDFLETLRKVAKFKGRVYAIYYGEDKETLKRIQKKYKVNFIQKNASETIITKRIKDFYKLLKEIEEDNVMISDGGDV